MFHRPKFLGVMIALAITSYGSHVAYAASVSLQRVGVDQPEHSGDRHEHREQHEGEHGRENEGSHSEEGEEAGIQHALDEQHGSVRKGVRLNLSFDQERNVFEGSVENTTDVSLKRVRVEVHLSSGVELGPTVPIDLEPGVTRDVELTATSRGFEKWSTHVEVGSGEHGHDGAEKGDRGGAGGEGEV